MNQTPPTTSASPESQTSVPLKVNAPAAAEKARRGGGKLGDFWRAARFVFPYRRLMIISIVAAFFVGLATTGGLTMLLPIMRVLLNEDTVAHYVDRSLAEKRLGLSFDENSKDALRVIRVPDKSPARAAGVRVGDEIRTAAGRRGPAAAAEILTATGDARAVELVSAEGTRQVSIAAHAAPWYSPALRAVAGALPVNPIASLAVMLSAILGLAVVGNCFRYFQEYYSDRVAIYSVEDVRKRTYDHALHVPLAYFGTKGTSDITSRLVSDCANLREGFRLLLGQSVQAPITAGMALGLAVWLDWRLTAVILVFAPVMVAIIRKFGTKIRRASRVALEKNAKLLGQLDATFVGIRVVKAARAERLERRRYSKIMGELVEQQERMSRAEALTTPVMETLTLAVVSGVVVFAAYLVLVDRTLEVTTFFLIMACLVQMGESFRRIGKLNNILQRANAAAGRIFEILDLPVERRRELRVSTPAGGDPTHEERLVSLPEISTAIRFEGVSFKYPNTDAWALRDVTLEVPRGKVVAVVGRNGSGKTTLLALLPRFYDPTEGRVTIDGVDLRRATLPSLRGMISLVTQDAVIFPGTVHENIAYGLPLATRAEVIEAAKRAFAHDFIVARPGGYDAPLEGLGGGLSGGQRQRLCIARAFLRRAPILILDEATSQVDAESEHLIQQAIDSLMHQSADGPHAILAGTTPAPGGGTTTFVIAHRFSTILSADEIVVIDQGRLIATGKHKLLLDTCPTYRQLYERQTLS